MKTREFIKRSRFNASPEKVFRWHTREGAFQRLNPPWAPAKLLHQSGGIQDGAKVNLATRLGPLWLPWELEHRDYVPDKQFRDILLRGPFPHWEHLHRIGSDGSGGSYLEDRIEYAAPLGPLGDLFAAGHIERELARVFEYRHRVLAQDLDAHSRYESTGPMKVLVTGASGLVGSALINYLRTGGHQVLKMVRSKPREGEVFWDPAFGVINPDGLEDLDAVVHLAGENIAEGRWTRAKKERIRHSRTEGTRLLAESLAGLKSPPKVLVAASAIGFYGDRGEEILHETSAPGTGFLAGLVQDWEAATAPASEAGIRVVNLRLGMVLSPAGGALAKMLTPFRMGVGGRIGTGNQYISWITLDDAIGAIHHALADEGLSGPVNGVAPNAVTNQEFTHLLGRVVKRPSVFPVPGWAAQLAFGEMARETLLVSTRVEPNRLLSRGYRFRFTDLGDSLAHLLGNLRETASTVPVAGLE